MVTEGPESQSDTIVLRGFSNKHMDDSGSDTEAKDTGMEWSSLNYRKIPTCGFG